METYRVNGIAVVKYSPEDKEKNADKPPIVMVHGGNCGAWCWELWGKFFSEAGYEVHVLEWYNHGQSDTFPVEEFVKRGMHDIAETEVTQVVEHIGRTPIIIGHSMGGMVAALYAASHAVERLVLAAPVLPAIAQADPIPLPPFSMDAPFPVFPYEQAKQFFFPTMNDEEAQKYYGLLVVESPQIVAETAGWLTQLDPGAIKAPVLVLADDHDVLIPLEPLKRYADLLHADFEVVKGVGHIDMLVKEHDWRAGALEVLKWLKKG